MTERTTVVFPPELKRRAVSRARHQGISFGEFVRRAVEKEVAVPSKLGSKSKTGDPFWDNLKTFDDDSPPDLSTRIDEFLYDEPR
jgi:hypothetical protein